MVPLSILYIRVKNNSVPYTIIVSKHTKAMKTKN